MADPGLKDRGIKRWRRCATPLAFRELKLATALLLSAILFACNREGPRAAATDTVDPGPTPEDFCAQVDRLSADELADATPDEKRAAHSVCVQASTEDRVRYPEWAPCARCMMEVSSMEAYDTRCHATCAPLEAKMQAAAQDDASTDG